MREQRIVIVGAGPGGAACALALARSARREIVLLDRAVYPRRKVCGSGLSPAALGTLKQLRLLDELEPKHEDMNGVRAFGPDGQRVVLAGSKAAWVVPRVEFDNTLARAAANEGVDFREGTRVDGVLHDPKGNVRGVKTKSEEIEADFVVFANGSPSVFERDPSPKTGIRTIMGWWQVRMPDDLGIMVWDRRLDGYYAWAFPEPCGVTNIGLTIKDDAPRAKRLRELFAELLEDHFSSLTRQGDQIGKWMGHPAVVTTRIGPITEDHALYIGEAARLVCPATVEGIGFAMKSGVLAAEMLARHQRADGSVSRFAQLRYRLDLATRMVPIFLAGEGYYRLIRNDRARRAVARVINAESMANRLTTLLGARPEPGRDRYERADASPQAEV